MNKNGVEPSSMPVRTRTGVPAKYRERPPGDPPSPNGNRAESTERIERIIVYMRQHSDQPLQVSALTTLANLSPSHFFALFKRATGHTPIDYFIHLRMHRACELLAGTGLSVKEVAATLGYDDPFYFSRVFKSINGVAPSDYRIRLARSGRTGENAPLTRSEDGDAEKSLPPPPTLEPITAQGGNQRVLREKSDKFHSGRKPVCADDRTSRSDENKNTPHLVFLFGGRTATDENPARQQVKK